MLQISLGDDDITTRIIVDRPTSSNEDWKDVIAKALDIPNKNITVKTTKVDQNHEILVEIKSLSGPLYNGSTKHEVLDKMKNSRFKKLIDAKKKENANLKDVVIVSTLEPKIKPLRIGKLKQW